MENKKPKVEFLAHIKQVKVRTLRSGDKEVALDLRVVGADTIFATKLADLPPGYEVKVMVE